MNSRVFSRTVALGLLWLLLIGASANYASEAIQDEELKQKAHEAIDRGLKWLRSQQEKNGSWQNHPGLTALALTAFTRSPRAYREEDGPFVRDAAAFLDGLAKPDGGIYDRDLPVYNTAVALMALCSTANTKYSRRILEARAFLVDQQADEGEGYKPSDKFYGGIGYGNDERPDLSNLHFALESLQASNLDRSDPTWARSLRFLERCQNRSESNDQAWATNDGGFVYAPGYSFAGGTSSYGSMTLAGLKSFLYAHLDRDDPRVKATIDWIRRNYTLKENPGLGVQALYYYYHTFAKALRVYGKAKITDDRGESHRWGEDLAKELLRRQSDEGSWVNSESSRWWEGNKILVTAEAVMALEEALAPLGLPEAPCPALTVSGPGTK